MPWTFCLVSPRVRRGLAGVRVPWLGVQVALPGNAEPGGACGHIDNGSRRPHCDRDVTGQQGRQILQDGVSLGLRDVVPSAQAIKLLRDDVQRGVRNIGEGGEHGHGRTLPRWGHWGNRFYILLSLRLYRLQFQTSTIFLYCTLIRV